MSVREYYRRTFFFMQIAILAICAVLYFRLHMPFEALTIFALVMEVGAIAGAFWGTRLSRKIQHQRDRMTLLK